MTTTRTSTHSKTYQLRRAMKQKLQLHYNTRYVQLYVRNPLLKKRALQELAARQTCEEICAGQCWQTTMVSPEDEIIWDFIKRTILRKLFLARSSYGLPQDDWHVLYSQMPAYPDSMRPIYRDALANFPIRLGVRHA